MIMKACDVFSFKDQALSLTVIMTNVFYDSRLSFTSVRQHTDSSQNQNNLVPLKCTEKACVRGLDHSKGLMAFYVPSIFR